MDHLNQDLLNDNFSEFIRPTTQDIYKVIGVAAAIQTCKRFPYMLLNKMN